MLAPSFPETNNGFSRCFTISKTLLYWTRWLAWRLWLFFGGGFRGWMRLLFSICSLNTVSVRTGSVTPVFNVQSGLIIQSKQRWNLACRNVQAFSQTGCGNVVLAAFQAAPADHSHNKGIWFLCPQQTAALVLGSSPSAPGWVDHPLICRLWPLVQPVCLHDYYWRHARFRSTALYETLSAVHAADTYG